jgi:D-alanine-D-alanine ligase-like ATP-grasp enzyme
MIDLTPYPRLLRFLSLGYMSKAVLRRLRAGVKEAKNNRERFYDQVWRSATEELGATVSVPCNGVLEFECDNDTKVRVRSNYTTLDDPVTLFVAGNKPAVHRALAAQGLPTPEYADFSLANINLAVSFLQASDQSCVVKPAAGTGAGQGITTGISRRSHLASAAAWAACYHRDLVIERQVAGDNYRLLYLDGVLLDAIKRNPPTLVGDGVATVRSLLRKENARRLNGWKTAQVLLRVDADMKQTLAQQDLSFRSVPVAGQRIVLKTVVNDNSARDNESASESLCTEIVDAGAQAAHALGVRLAGVDIITTDPTRSLQETDGVILEINTTPGLYHHKRGDTCPVAVPILAAMLKVKQHAAVVDCSY